MGISRTRRATLLYLVLQIGTIALALWASKEFQVARMAATLIALAPTVPASYLAWSMTGCATAASLPRTPACWSMSTGFSRCWTAWTRWTLTQPITIIGLFAIQRAGRSEVPQPRTGQLHRLRDRTQRRQLAATVLRAWFTVGIATGIAVGTGPGLNAGFDGGPAHGIAVGFSVALSVALAVAVAAALSNPLGDPATTTAHRSGLAAPTNPTSPVRDDLVGGLLGGFVGGAVFVAGLAVVSLAANLVFTLGLAIVAGLAVGPVLGLSYFTGAGRRYVVFLCCSRGRLPWRLGTFLNWAYEAGLLRISGIAYQFRHRELQDWLTSHPGSYAVSPPR